MNIQGWKYYNRGAIPTTPPHLPPDLLPVEDGRIWRVGNRRPWLARWTEDFDCGEETAFWYVIKDTPFDVATLKAKRRYEITRGQRYFDVKEIDPNAYKEDLYEIVKAAWEAYPAAYRPTLDRQRFIDGVASWRYYKVYGAFSRETGVLSAYALLRREGRYIDFYNLKARPEAEPFGVNAALIAALLADQRVFLEEGGYICDGARNVSHETAFQDYLEKYFGFRKAYCRLRVRYRWPIGWAVCLLYPLRRICKRHALQALLRTEELARQCRTQKH